jgi:hypothetical protein
MLRPALRFTVSLLVVGATLGTRPSAAQPTDAPSAAELFRQGREALANGNYPIACTKFEESVRLEPHVGTMISLAECEEAQAHLARARAYWQEAVTLARALRDSREAKAAAQFERIDARVPRLTLRRPATAPSDLAVSRDHVAMGEGSLDLPLPVEVGAHTVSVSAGGFATNTVTVELAEGEAKELELELGATQPAPPLPAATVAGTPAPAAPTRLLRPIALGSGALGVVALGVGTGFGIEALRSKGQPNGACGVLGCNAQGSARNAALLDGNVATALFVTGGALIATGAVLWLLAPSKQRARDTVGVELRLGAGSIAVRESF